MSDTIFLVCHVQRTSARVTFLRRPDGGFGWPHPITAAATLAPDPQQSVVAHPGAALTQLRQHLHLAAAEDLMIESEFRAWLALDEAIQPVLLARLTAMDAPHPVAEAVEGRLVTLLDIRRRPDAEMQLLRTAYETLLTG